MTTFTLKSKTHIFGAALGIFGALASFLPQIQEMVSPEVYSYLFMATSVAVIVLRNITTMPIGDK